MSSQWYLMQVGKESKSFYIVKDKSFLTKSDPFRVGMRLKFTYYKVIRYGLVIRISDDLEKLEREKARLEPKLWMVVQYSNVHSSSFIHGVFNNKELKGKAKNFTVRGIVSVDNEEGTFNGKILFIAKNEIEALEHLQRLNRKAIGEMTERGYSFEADEWHLVKFNQNEYRMHYAVINCLQEKWKSNGDENFNNFVAFVTDPFRVVLATSTDKDALLEELDKLRVTLQSKIASNLSDSFEEWPEQVLTRGEYEEHCRILQRFNSCSIDDSVKLPIKMLDKADYVRPKREEVIMVRDEKKKVNNKVLTDSSNTSRMTTRPSEKRKISFKILNMPKRPRFV